MNTTPTVTVVIPTYRRPELVVRAVNSVLRQTYQDFEIIVVDDASPDNTKDVIAAMTDPRIRYIRHEENKRLPAVRNTGVRAATGKYIAFLDDDDEWRSDKLEKQLESIQNYDAVVCAAQASGKVITHHKGKTVTLSDLRKGNQWPPSGLLVRTSVLRELPFDESLRQAEDWDANIRIAQKYSIGYVAEPLLLYNDGAHGRITNTAVNLAVEDLEKRMPILHKHREFFGPFWYRRHVAMFLLFYIGKRRNMFRHIIYTIRRCGTLPVASVLFFKVRRRLFLAFGR